jgi:hypothetical protein
MSSKRSISQAKRKEYVPERGADGLYLGDRIVELRAFLGSVRRPLSQADLTEEMRPHLGDETPDQSTIARYEANKAMPPTRVLRVMARLRRKPLHEFVFGEPDPHAAPPLTVTRSADIPDEPPGRYPPPIGLSIQEMAAKLEAEGKIPPQKPKHAKKTGGKER